VDKKETPPAHPQQQQEEEESISPSNATNTQERRACE